MHASAILQRPAFSVCFFLKEISCPLAGRAPGHACKLRALATIITGHDQNRGYGGVRGHNLIPECKAEKPKYLNKFEEVRGIGIFSPDDVHCVEADVMFCVLAPS